MAATEGIPNRTTTTKTYPDGAVETTVKESVSFYPVAAMFLLKRWRPEYRESYRVEASGPDDGKTQIDSLERIDAQVAVLTEELRRRGRRVGPRDLVDPELLVDGRRRPRLNSGFAFLPQVRSWRLHWTRPRDAARDSYAFAAKRFPQNRGKSRE